jgi:hypothetical protein
MQFLSVFKTAVQFVSVRGCTLHINWLCCCVNKEQLDTVLYLRCKKCEYGSSGVCISCFVRYITTRTLVKCYYPVLMRSCRFVFTQPSHDFCVCVCFYVCVCVCVCVCGVTKTPSTLAGPCIIIQFIYV